MFSTPYPPAQREQPPERELYMQSCWNIVLRLRASKYECLKLLPAGLPRLAADIAQQTLR
jgi:hypothetical protein